MLSSKRFIALPSRLLPLLAPEIKPGRAWARKLGLLPFSWHQEKSPLPERGQDCGADAGLCRSLQLARQIMLAASHPNCNGDGSANGTAARRPGHVVADQSEVAAFLGDSATHSVAGPVKRFETHGAMVFLAGENAYKLKRAVKFPFMDFSTPEKRRLACEAEVSVNRPNAPDLYLGVRPVTRSGGRLALGGEGEAVDWVVHMRRFDEEQTLDRVAARGELSDKLIAELVAAVLASHGRALMRPGEPAVAALHRYVGENTQAFAETPDLFPPQSAAALSAAARHRLSELEPLLLDRGRAGWVRRCHGDLHLRNLVLIDGKPTLFDAVEFDESIATGDVLYDLAYLLMDLWQAGLRPEANRVLNRYLWAGAADDHLAGLAAMPLFLSLRAAIRAKVVAAALPHLKGKERDGRRAEARRDFDLAVAFLQPAPARLIAVGGLPGTGKSTLAARLAAEIGCPPGAVHLRSDIERKLLFGVAETERLPEAAYSRETTDRVYDRLRHKATLALEAGHSVIADAMHGDEAERVAIRGVAEETGAPFQGLWLEAPVPVLLDRVARRSGDASDATAEVVRRFAETEAAPADWHRVPAAVGLDTVITAAQTALARV
jgi:uncharacterized protein